jgi:hypothetical protein
MITPKVVSLKEPVYIMFNGSIKDTVDWKQDTIPLQTFVERLATSYDLDVVFQRNSVWTDTMKANLIRSIMTGTPIGDCLLCEQPTNVALKNVIDFKNRSLAIKDFWENKFTVPISIQREPDGPAEIKNMTWGDIQRSADPQLKNLKEEFPQYKIHTITYKGMNLVQQSERFLIINTNMPMKQEELLYADNFWVKGLFSHVFKICFPELMKHTRAKQEIKDIHQKGVIFAHRVCYTCFGANFNDVWALRELGNSGHRIQAKPLVRDAKTLNAILASILDQEKTVRIDDNFIKRLEFYPKIDLLKKVCNSLAAVLSFNNASNKKLMKNDLLDITIFFMRKVLEEKLTMSMLRDNKPLYLSIITKYVKSKAEKKCTGQSTHTNMLAQRAEIFEEVWRENNSDDDRKHPVPTPYEKTIALLESPATCPITGEAIHNGNVRTEHIDCGAKHSTSTYTIVSETGNQWKADRTLEEIEKVKAYMEENNSHSPA